VSVMGVAFGWCRQAISRWRRDCGVQAVFVTDMGSCPSFREGAFRCKPREPAGLFEKHSKHLEGLSR